MGFSKTQKEIIRKTWTQVKEVRGSNAEFGRTIFLRLFELAPGAQQLFPFRDESLEELKTSKKLGRHGANFVGFLDKAVKGLDNMFGDVGPKFVGLGARHYGYGTEEAHYAIVGQTLMDVLSSSLGADFTPEIKQAWVDLYDIIQAAMMEGQTDH